MFAEMHCKKIEFIGRLTYTNISDKTKAKVCLDLVKLMLQYW